MSRRAKIIVAVLLLLLVVRVCLPLAIEKAIEVAGNRLLDGIVQVDDVDLGILAGTFALEGLRVDRHTSGATGELPPIATLAHLAVNAGTSALLEGRLHVQEVTVTGGSLHLERSEQGDLILPLSEEARAAIEAPPQTPPDPNADFLPLPLRLDVLRLSDLHAKIHDPIDDVTSASLDLTGFELDGLSVAGRRAELARIAVVEPAVLLDRGLIGGPRAMIREPESAVEEDAIAELATEGETGAEAAAPEPPAPATDPADDAAPRRAETDARLAEVSVAGARLTWVDRTHDPVIREESKDFSLVANDLVVSERGLAHLQIRGQGLRGEPFELTGSPGGDGSVDFYLVAKEFDLTPFGPYATEVAGYEVKQGRVSIDSEVRFDFPRIESKNGITLDSLRLGGTGPLESSLGMSASLVIALLSGPDGRIHLNVPLSLELDEEATELALEEIQGAVQESMHRSLEGVGAVERDGGARFEPLRSAPGEPALEAGQDARLASIAKLLREKPAVAVELRGVVAAADTAALAARRGVSPEALSDAERDALAAQRVEAAKQALVAAGAAAGQIRTEARAQGSASGVVWSLALSG